MNGFRENFRGPTSHPSNASLQSQVRALEDLFITKKTELEQCENRIRILEDNLQKICGRMDGIFGDLSYSAVEKIRAEICRSVCGSKARDVTNIRPARSGRRLEPPGEDSDGLRNNLSKSISSYSDQSVTTYALSKLPQTHRSASFNASDSDSEIDCSRVSDYSLEFSQTGEEEEGLLGGGYAGTTSDTEGVYSRKDSREESVSGHEFARPDGCGRGDDDSTSDNEDTCSRVSRSEDSRVYVYVCADDPVRFIANDLQGDLRPDHRVEHMISSTRLMENWTKSLLRKQERGKFVSGDVIVLMVGRVDAIKRRVFEMRDELNVLLKSLREDIAVIVVGVTRRFDLDPKDMMNINIARLNHWIRVVLESWSHRAGFVNVDHLTEGDFRGKFLNEIGQRQVVMAIEKEIQEVRRRCLAICGNYARE